ncbi:Hsp70 family protein [Candidatus Proelusimicrobium excrementi]|uniref:Hsp70 family protein n=1 Tax=Candidatus Proelusimicrobium excrementi TaxID=3416222 RepID=UPI003CA6994C|nr:Hsp70 family protein [Elusimicrobiaceae bacterium]
MKHFIGIDLGTTNSAICSYNGEETHIYQSPRELSEVTPSAIYINKRGSKYLGQEAYKMLLNDPDNVVVRFKRFMGTNTPMNIPNLGHSMSPEECSAEILKLLFNYLPEELRNSPDGGTVITVPAAFNQMQKEATLQAANMAGIGKVALMQEPVAAIMSVMKARIEDGIFIVYDLGGGTLDVAVAESINGHVSLLSHGGIAMCGGRDFDRSVLENIVYPWLSQNFKLPTNFGENPSYGRLVRMSAYAAESAKIKLSTDEQAIINVMEEEMRMQDEDGKDIYLNIPIARDQYNELISAQIEGSIKVVRETLSKAGLQTDDVVRIVFVGGPTCYKPMREKISSALGIPANTDVNPMTAVAEGAALFAESIDWTSQEHSRKDVKGSLELQGDINIQFDYIARTPDVKTKLIMHTGSLTGNYELQIDSVETGWSSGKIKVADGNVAELLLSKYGENNFKVFLFNDYGQNIPCKTDKITITRTAATVDFIPASYSVGIEVLDKVGGTPVLDYLVRAGDTLPKQGTKHFKAASTLKAGDPSSLNFKIWEGDISSPITDNRPVGLMKISGTDFDDGVIYAGADIDVNYQMSDDGNIRLEISIPSIRSSFNSAKNFYSRQEGQKDYSELPQAIIFDAKNTKERADEMAEHIEDPELDNVRNALEQASNLSDGLADPEKAKEAEEKVLQAKKDLAAIRRKHLRETRKMELDKEIEFFNNCFQKDATPMEKASFDNLVASAKRMLERETHEFEDYISEIKTKLFAMLWKRDWFVVARFQNLIEKPFLFSNKDKFKELVAKGHAAIQADQINSLRQVVFELEDIRQGGATIMDDSDITNIVRG